MLVLEVAVEQLVVVGMVEEEAVFEVSFAFALVAVAVAVGIVVRSLIGN